MPEPTKDNPLFFRQLRRVIGDHFDIIELEILTFDLGLVWDELKGETLSIKCQSLIASMQRKGHLPDLLSLLNKERPDVEWPKLPIPPTLAPKIQDDLPGEHLEALNKPQLLIQFDADEEPFLGRVVDASYHLAAFYRLTIENISPHAIQNCKAVLASVEPMADTQSRKLGRPVTLKWAHEEDFLPITIEAGESRKLDLIIKFINFPEFFEFYFDVPTFAGMSRRFLSGTYVITVRIQSNEKNLAKASFIIKIDQKSLEAQIKTVD